MFTEDAFNSTAALQDTSRRHRYNDAFRLDSSPLTVLVNGYVIPVVVTITLVTNCLVCIVLLRKELRGPTNLLLVALSISDTLTAVLPTPFFVYFYSTGFYSDYVPYDFCLPYFCLTDYLPTMSHTASIWLTVALAAHRYVCVCRTPARTTGIVTSAYRADDMRKIACVIVGIYAAAIAAHVNRFLDLRFYERKMMPTKALGAGDFKSEALNGIFQRVTIALGVVGETSRIDRTFNGNNSLNKPIGYFNYTSVDHTAHHVMEVNACVHRFVPFVLKNADIYFNVYYWMRVLLIHIVPCAALVALNGLLVRAMRAAARRRNQLRRENRGCAERRRLSESNSTTLMLTVVVTVMLMVELPLAVLLVITVWENSFRVEIISEETTHLAGILVNATILFSYPVNFFIYCAMSRQFRNAFRSLFLRRVCVGAGGEGGGGSGTTGQLNGTGTDSRNESTVDRGPAPPSSEGAVIQIQRVGVRTNSRRKKEFSI